MTEILNFIKQFRDLGATNCFANGMCYWFAQILYSRFCSKWGACIYYNPILNHFACFINNNLYDINGLINTHNDNAWTAWSNYQYYEPLDAARVYQNCVLKEYD